MTMRRSVGLVVVLVAAALSVATSEAIELVTASDDNELRVFLDSEQERFRVRLIADGAVADFAGEATVQVIAELAEIDPEAAGLGACEAGRAPFGITNVEFAWSDGVVVTSLESPGVADADPPRVLLTQTDGEPDVFLCDDGCEAVGTLTLQREPAEGGGCVAADLAVTANVALPTQDADVLPGDLIVVIERVEDPAP